MSFDDRDLLEHLPHLRRFAVSLLRNRYQADDLVQDCLVRALTKKHLFRTGTNLRSWLFTVMHNLFIDHQRHANDRRLADVSLDALDRVGVQPRQGHRLVLKELETALAALPDQQRSVLLLVALEGYSYQEAAMMTRVPIGTVRSRVSRARGLLREKLQFGGSFDAGACDDRDDRPDPPGSAERAAGDGARLVRNTSPHIG